MFSTTSSLPPTIFDKAAVFYRTLDVEAILETVRRLERRISERFPSSGLLSICHELVSLAEDVQQRANAIAAPNIALRAAVYILISAGVAGLLIIAFGVRFQIGNAELLTVLQAVEAAANIVVLLGAAVLFLISLETRLKRNRSLRDLHVFRSIAHVIDMHQLTKDPSSALASDHVTASSPQRTMTPFELTRYLDYCSEMLSLTSKLAAVYARNCPIRL